MLEASRVSFAYGQVFALREVTLRVSRGQILGILGPNGSGKSTLLRLLAGIARPTHGHVTLENLSVSSIARWLLAKRLAIVPQETHLAFEYTVLEMALMGRYPHLGPLELEGPDDVAIARQALAATGTGGFADRPFTTLSGGEKQRVTIASALAQLHRTMSGVSPQIMLLDEPTAALDLRYQFEIASLLRTLNERDGITMVVSTHDLNFAASICDQLALLRGGELLESGPTADVLTATNVQRLYGVTAEVAFHERAGHLTVVPISAAHHDLESQSPGGLT